MALTNFLVASEAILAEKMWLEKSGRFLALETVLITYRQNHSAYVFWTILA
jgi:uncharacterized protein (DUF608 family)